MLEESVVNLTIKLGISVNQRQLLNEKDIPTLNKVINCIGVSDDILSD